jgi:xylulokinase
VYGQPVEILQAEEGAAYGAALLAGVGAGTWSSVDEACEQSVRVARKIEPHKGNISILNKQYEAYRRLYPALRALRSQ